MAQDRSSSSPHDDDPTGPYGVAVRPDKPSPSDGDTPCLLVGVNRHPSSYVALQTAARLATQLRARLKVVHVVDLSDFPIDPDSFDWDTAAEAAQEEQRRQVTRELAHFGGPWTFNLQRGDPARVLTDMANQSAALMVVIGSGRSGALASLLRALKGSVGHSLIGPHRRCPLLVVPAGCAALPDDSEESDKIVRPDR